jgi:hypothetical protein
VSRRSAAGGVAPALVLIIATIAGAVGGVVVATLAGREWPAFGLGPVASAAPLILAAVAFAAGIIVAWFLAFVILSWTPGRFRCPRCGTANGRSERSCAGCLLPFA